MTHCDIEFTLIRNKTFSNIDQIDSYDMQFMLLILQAMSSLGEVQLISHVLVHQENSEKRERLFVLFPGVLVMLSIGTHPSGYTYEVNNE